MEPKKSRRKGLIVTIVVVLVLIGFTFYYTAAVRNASNRPTEVERES